MASTACKLCNCSTFTPNQWRRTLCQKCYHGYSAHGSGKVQQWYIAKIEGPYSWEQCRHWMDSGYFPASDKILVCSIAANPTLDAAHAERPGVHAPFQLLSDAFPDGSPAFVPAELAEKYKRSSSAGSGGKVTPAGASSGGSADGSTGEPSNMVDPMQAKMKAGWMKSFFTGGTAWYFIDDAGVTQGPFDPDTMSAWFAAGYFWSKGLKIGHQGWSSFIPLQTILDGEGKPQSIAALAAAAPAPAPAAAASGSSSTGVAAGALHAPVPATAHGAAAAPAAPVVVPSLSMPNPAAINEWMYVDESGNVQGPFTGEQMAEWTAWGYFHGESKIRNVGAMPDGVFLPLGVLFPDPGPDATDEELDATAPFESECWKEVWRKHNAGNVSVRR